MTLYIFFGSHIMYHIRMTLLALSGPLKMYLYRYMMRLTVQETSKQQVAIVWHDISVFFRASSVVDIAPVIDVSSFHERLWKVLSAMTIVVQAGTSVVTDHIMQHQLSVPLILTIIRCRGNLSTDHLIDVVGPSRLHTEGEMGMRQAPLLHDVKQVDLAAQ